ncbi:MAG TPA: DNA polymerase Y family protein [Mycobacteriales bacterium]|nr:DNA polymerase Y family protein [Mycobacteriales bacterium]
MAATRTVTLWCPDWPLTAVGIPADAPAAVLVDGAVLACSASARREGVRRGIRRREAQRRCPPLRLLDRDPAQEMRAFEPVLAALASVCPEVEVVRPGLCLFAARGPARYFGGDAALAQVTAAAAGTALPDTVRVGIADGRFAAGLAAREAAIVPRGGSAAFLAPQPVSTLERPALAVLLARLGLVTLGDVAALPARQVATRFGAEGERAHQLARGLDEQRIAVRIPPPELAVQEELDPPLDQIEPLAFVAKRLADELSALLASRGLGCDRLGVQLETEHGETQHRLWRHDGTLTASAVAQRVRWQLTGWLGGSSAVRPSAGITLIRLVPGEVYRDVGEQLSLFHPGLGDDTGDGDERAATALNRLQGLLGFDAVHLPVPAGGRRPAEQARLVPWGEPRPARHRSTPPWPGRLPAPNPTLLHPGGLPAQVVDATGTSVLVDDRGAISAAPVQLSIGGGKPTRIVDWAGPWPVDERWWYDPAEHRSFARFQVVTTDGTARLLTVQQGQWRVEGTYD